MIATKAYAAQNETSPLAPFSLERRDPLPTDVAIDILYCGVCHSDLHQARGEWHNTIYPCVPGHEIVGRVSKVGAAVKKFKVGDLVACLSIYDAEATFTNQPEKYLVPVPADLDLKVATALILDWNTAYGMVKGRISQGDKVFVHGMSGAVGYALTMLCKASGAEVYGTASERNHAAIRDLGAHPFVYTNKDWIEAMQTHAICMLDPTGIVCSWNSGAERIKGYRAEEIIGQHFSRFYTREDRENGLPHRALTIATRDRRFEAEGWRVRKDGSPFWANVVIDAIYDGAGVLIGFAKITRDMTERRAVDEQLHQAQKMEAVGQLTNGVAHDFNNLLATIIPNLELAMPHVKEERVLGYLENAMHAAERGGKLTNQLLAFSRRHDLLTEPVDVNNLISETCEMLPRTIGPTITIEMVLDGDLWPAMTEVGQLELAILNLAINARDAMLAGGKLTISTTKIARGDRSRLPHVDPGDYVMISVADTGTGMSEEVRSRAFEPFFTTKEAGKGTGLGLSMVYGFAKQSGGTVTIDSEIGKGTTFRIYLPRAQHRLGDTEEAGYQSQRKAGPPSRILLVDDDSAVRTVTGTLLRTFGHEVIESASGEAALDFLERDQRFDLLIIDVAMPNMHGGEFATRARRFIPGVPTLFVSGYTEERRIHEMTQGHVLKKPFRQTELAEKLRHILQRPGRRNGHDVNGRKQRRSNVRHTRARGE